MKKIINGISTRLVQVERCLIYVLLPVMCVVVLLNTFSRITGIFTDQMLWAEEFARYIMIWMAFIGAALVMQTNGHYKMTAIIDKLPGSAKSVARFVSAFVTIAFMIKLGQVGLECCVKIMSMGQKSPILKIPMWVPYAAIPVGMFLGAAQAILREVMSFWSKMEDCEK